MKKALIWKLLERFGVLGAQFILQIILARLLTPDHYGVLALMVIFTTLANVFIQNGFNTALIQNKDVTEADYSSVLWVSLGVAGVLYVILFFGATVIADFYEMPDLVAPFRVLCLMLFPGAVNSVQLAKVSREMEFKKVFYSNVIGVVISGAAGIVVALLDGGLWALVTQTLLNTVAACVVMKFTVQLKIALKCDMKRVKVLFSYGWKLLVSSLLDTLYQDFSSLIIGKKYNSGTLGFYNRGKQFPQFAISAVNGAVQSVLLPAMSAQQDDKASVKEMVRKSIIVGSYVIFPMMFGLAGVATPIIQLLLTDKWLPCVPYMQCFCLSLMFYPLYTSNLQAINAMGRSDIFLKMEIVKKSIGVAILAIAVFCFESPLAIALSSVVSIPVDIVINAWPNKKLIGYPVLEQIKDVLPAFVLAAVMFAAVMVVQKLELGLLLTLAIQVIVGVAVYLLLSVLFKPAGFTAVLEQATAVLKNRSRR